MRGAADRCPDDLLARSRRSALSPVERRALAAHLGVCDLCRAAVALGALHDDIPDVPSDDDDAVVARLAGRVVARAIRRPARARGFAIAAGVALLVLAGAAAAWVAGRRAFEPTVHVAETPTPPRAREPVPIAVAMPATEPVTEPVIGRPALGDRRRRRTPVGARAPSDRLAPAETPHPDGPDRLFAEANEARGAGDLREAAERYERLERQYPDSPEAVVSLVSAGDLLARLGDPAEALHRFDSYLARNTAGALAPEALFGRARCLRELGRRLDEADAWRALVERFPGSLYDRTARRRLDELRPDGPAR